jgi:hypothetical protein
VTFTYDLTASGDDLVVSQIRLKIGDKTQNEGLLPGGDNFADAELLELYGQEGDHVERAAAAALEIAARQWRRKADISVGDYREAFSQVAAGLAEDAKALRDAYGYGETGGTYSVGVTRLDGYSQDVPSSQVDDHNVNFD